MMKSVHGDDVDDRFAFRALQVGLHLIFHIHFTSITSLLSSPDYTPMLNLKSLAPDSIMMLLQGTEGKHEQKE